MNRQRNCSGDSGASPFAVERVLQARQPRAERRRRQHEDPLRRRRADRDAGGAVPAVEEELRDQAAEGMADDDRRPVEIADDPLVVATIPARPRPRRADGSRRMSAGARSTPGQPSGDRVVPLLRVTIDPGIPAVRGHPHAVDQEDRLGGHAGTYRTTARPCASGARTRLSRSSQAARLASEPARTKGGGCADARSRVTAALVLAASLLAGAADAQQRRFVRRVDNPWLPFRPGTVSSTAA